MELKNRNTICKVLIVFCILLFGLSIQSYALAVEVDKVYIVNEYRYVPATASDNTDAGQAFCGTRCNGLSVDYQNFLKPPGWRLIRVAQDKQISVDMNNPFIEGKCICIADEYVVKVNDLYMSK